MLDFWMRSMGEASGYFSFVMGFVQSGLWSSVVSCLVAAFLVCFGSAFGVSDLGDGRKYDDILPPSSSFSGDLSAAVLDFLLSVDVLSSSCVRF